jgi:hypothetical protein
MKGGKARSDGHAQADPWAHVLVLPLFAGNKDLNSAHLGIVFHAESDEFLPLESTGYREVRGSLAKKNLRDGRDAA